MLQSFAKDARRDRAWSSKQTFLTLQLFRHNRDRLGAPVHPPIARRKCSWAGGEGGGWNARVDVECGTGAATRSRTADGALVGARAHLSNRLLVP